MKEDFFLELQNLINRHGLENESNTPDFVLAAYIKDCLSAYTSAVKQRDILQMNELMETVKI